MLLIYKLPSVKIFISSIHNVLAALAPEKMQLLNLHELQKIIR